MPRKSQPQFPASRRVGFGVVWFRWKLIVTLSAALCILALLSIHLQSRPSETLPSLSVARSRIPLRKYSGDRPKIAFLFLARRDLPLDFLWDRFFKVLKLVHVFDQFISVKIGLILCLLVILAGCRSEEFLNLCTFSTWFRIR